MRADREGGLETVRMARSRSTTERQAPPRWRSRQVGLRSIVLAHRGIWAVLLAAVVACTTVPVGSPSTSRAAPENTQLPSGSVRLLDGRLVSFLSPRALSLAGYSFAIRDEAIRGQREVTVVEVEDPGVLAASQNAQFDSDVDDRSALWLSEGPGSPLFMTVDLGHWVVMLQVGTQLDPPDYEGLPALAAKLTGTATAEGLVMDGIEYDSFESYLVAGDGDSVTLRVNQCFAESSPNLSVVTEPELGTVFRTDRFASWCHPEGAYEVVVSGTPTFVDQMTEAFRPSLPHPTD